MWLLLSLVSLVDRWDLHLALGAVEARLRTDMRQSWLEILVVDILPDVLGGLIHLETKPDEGRADIAVEYFVADAAVSEAGVAVHGGRFLAGSDN